MLLKRRKTPRMGVREPSQISCSSHVQWVRRFECAVHKKAPHECGGDVEAAHVRTGTDGGMGLKPGDNWAIPLCAKHHIPIQHQKGEPAFERRYGIDMKKIAADLWRQSPHRLKWEKRNANDR